MPRGYPEQDRPFTLGANFRHEKVDHVGEGRYQLWTDLSTARQVRQVQGSKVVRASKRALREGTDVAEQRLFGGLKGHGTQLQRDREMVSAWYGGLGDVL